MLNGNGLIKTGTLTSRSWSRSDRGVTSRSSIIQMLPRAQPYSESSTLETEVYVWRYAVCTPRKEEHFCIPRPFPGECSPCVQASYFLYHSTASTSTVNSSSPCSDPPRQPVDQVDSASVVSCGLWVLRSSPMFPAPSTPCECSRGGQTLSAVRPGNYMQSNTSASSHAAAFHQ